MKDLKAIIGNSISYRGNLSVTLNVKGHKYPFTFNNHGTKHLLDTITRALAGYSITGATPRYIDFQHTLDGTQYQSVLKNLVPFTGIVYGEAADAEENEGRVLLNATLTYEDKQYITTLYSPRLVILDDEKRVLAEITEGDFQTLWNSITDATDALIEWKMIFTTV